MKKILASLSIFLNCSLLAAAPSPTRHENFHSSQTRYNRPASSIVYLNADNFQQILSNPLPIILDVYTDWCGPCKQLAPIFEELNKELGNRYLFVKLNADQQKNLSDHFNIQALPTLIFIRDGKELGRSSGFVNKSQLASMIKSYFGH
ncbi:MULTISPECIES: thioredoxin [unclassified Neochlamydia]|uniref:thioredoxin n=1 Tax=unclassified Neochlamydia TaxID=2643326 RepID=UPI001BC8F9A8|nr:MULTISPECIES: thioredoxin [unclassified Neochlamydia]MBS4167344.1 Uncharacterized protein [Neochlamydia sp. AcF65]MBS4171370.1 Uncharacterized protein [Neochlamydia sp. AcF95]